MKLIHYVKKLYGIEHLLHVYKKCVHAKRSNERFWGKISPEKLHNLQRTKSISFLVILCKLSANLQLRPFRVRRRPTATLRQDHAKGKLNGKCDAGCNC